MKVQTFHYSREMETSLPSFPEMDSDNTLILLFCAPSYIYHPEAISYFKKQYPKSQIMGCSTAGEIIGATVNDDSISVAIVRFDKTKIKIVGEVVNSSENSFVTGVNISKKLQGPSLRGIFVLSEGININGSELCNGLNSILEANDRVVITGGLAGDGENFKQTWVINQGKIETNVVVALGLYGDSIKIAYGAEGGWDIFGPERHITRSERNVVYELNDQPALELYKKFLADKASNLPASGLLFPLAIRENEEDKTSLVRTILGVNEVDQSLIFAGDMPLGYLAQPMRANFERLTASAADAANEAINMISQSAHENDSLFSIAISCVGRRLILGSQSEEETEAVLETLKNKSDLVGFYSYGELSPVKNYICDLHNQTMTLTVWSE